MLLGPDGGAARRDVLDKLCANRNNVDEFEIRS